MFEFEGAHTHIGSNLQRRFSGAGGSAPEWVRKVDFKLRMVVARADSDPTWSATQELVEL